MHDQLEQQITPHVRTMQIIVLALAMGPIIFAVIVYFAIPGGPPQADGILTRIGLVVTLVALVASPMLRNKIARQAIAECKTRGEDDPSRFLPAYQTSLIVGQAILEGAAFLNIVAYMQERAEYSLIAAALLIAANLMKFPTVFGVANWLRGQSGPQPST